MPLPMNPETISPLGPKGARLLAFLSGQITSGRIRKGEPETFIAYSEALSGMAIPKRGRAGQQLQREGLDELNDWTKVNPDLPKIAGLIVDKKNRRPSEGFAKSHGREAGDWEAWWLGEAAGAIDFDWSPHLMRPASRVEPAPRVREGEEAEAPSYREIITVEPGKRGGRPCIRGMRITVGDILGWLASGMSEAEIIDDFPELTVADIHAALAFAADRERHTVSLAAMHE